MYQLKVKSTDIVLVTFHREHMLRKTLRALKERTRFPHRIILIDNGSNFTEEDKKLISECCALYVKSPEGSTGFGPAENLGLKYVETEYFVVTCNDIIPPDLQPCWLERLSVLIETHPQFAGINCRAQYMPKYDYSEPEMQVCEQRVMLQGYLRIHRTEEMRRIGGIPFQPKGRYQYESVGFVRGVRELLKRASGSAVHIHCDHFGWEEENKGYPKDVDYEYKVRFKKSDMPELDPITCAPLGHVCPPWPYNDPNFVPRILSEEECIVEPDEEIKRPSPEELERMIKKRQEQREKERAIETDETIQKSETKQVDLANKSELIETTEIDNVQQEIMEKRKERWLKRRQNG